MATPTWTNAACQRPEVDADIFFPDNSDAAGIARAKAECARCPVIDACLEWALGFGPGAQHGVAGGLSAAERRTLHAAQVRTTRRLAEIGGRTDG